MAPARRLFSTRYYRHTEYLPLYCFCGKTFRFLLRCRELHSETQRVTVGPQKIVPHSSTFGTKCSDHCWVHRGLHVKRSWLGARKSGVLSWVGTHDRLVELMRTHLKAIKAQIKTKRGQEEIPVGGHRFDYSTLNSESKARGVIGKAGFYLMVTIRALSLTKTYPKMGGPWTQGLDLKQRLVRDSLLRTGRTWKKPRIQEHAKWISSPIAPPAPTGY